MFNAFEAVNNIIDEINENYYESCYDSIYEELCDRVAYGELTIEEAEMINEAAAEKYLYEKVRLFKKKKKKYEFPDKIKKTNYSIDGAKISYYYDPDKEEDPETIEENLDKKYNILKANYNNIINESIKYCLKIAKNWEMPENKMEMKKLLKLSSIHMSSYHNWNTFTFWFNDGKYCSDDFFCCHSLTCSCEIDLDKNKIKNIEVQLEG